MNNQISFTFDFPDPLYCRILVEQPAQNLISKYETNHRGAAYIDFPSSEKEEKLKQLSTLTGREYTDLVNLYNETLSCYQEEQIALFDEQLKETTNEWEIKL